MLCLIAVLLSLSMAAGADQITGRFEGSWSSTVAGVSGSFRLILDKPAEDELKAEVTFTMGDQEVKTKIVAVKTTADHIEAKYDFELQGRVLRSTITGKRTGSSLEGSYYTTTVAEGTPVDQGAWKAAAAQ